MGVVSAGGGHLQFLHAADPAIGIEHRAAGARHVPEAFQRGLAGIAAGGHDNADLALFAILFGSQAHQIGQEFERDVLESQRGAMKQFQHMNAFDERAHRSHIGVIPRIGSVGRVYRLLDFSDGVVLQKIAQDSRGALTVALPAQGGQPLAGNLGKQTGHIQAAVRSQAPQDGLRRGYASAATRGKKGHAITLQTGFGCFMIGSGSIIHGFGARVKPEMHEKGDGLSSRPPHHAKVQIT